MYRIEYDIETGLVHNLAIIEDENYPETLVDGVAYYEGDIPEDVEGYEKVLYYKLANTQESNSQVRTARMATFAVWEGNLYAEYKPIEGWMELADAKDVADLFIQSQKPKGLRFKSGDNSVYAKTMKSLVLGTDDFTFCFIGTIKGGKYYNNPVHGFTNALYASSSLRITPASDRADNSLGFIFFERPISQSADNAANSIQHTKIDTTDNLYHIVVSRSGENVKCVINGRLIKSVTQDRVLDFSNFIYDIANTSYFYGGSVYNYAMTEAEALALWNGGRYDEYVISSPMRLKDEGNVVPDPSKIYGGVTYATNVLSNYATKNDDVLEITYEILSKPTSVTGFYAIVAFNSSNSTYPFIIHIQDKEVGVYRERVKCNGSSTGFYVYTGQNWDTNGGRVKLLSIKTCRCLLEYKPENIRADRMINTGTAGSAYDLIYSLPNKPTIIYEAPYKDKIVLEDKTTPDFHPIAVGQRCYTSDGKILEAKLPAKGSEWQVSDWKLQ